MGRVKARGAVRGTLQEGRLHGTLAAMDIRTIVVAGEHPTVRFAAAELARYLGRATGARYAVASGVGRAGGIRVGTAAELGGEAAAIPAVEDPRADDAVLVAVERGVGLVAGTNPRSVLLAVYRFLGCLGFSWIRPGADGEIVPALNTDGITASLAERASYRHRGICIEGAVSLEHVRDLIDWMPKLGFNAYFLQFREAFTFFDRWYSHRDNPLREPEGVGIAEVREMVRVIEADIAKRDLLYHAVGHGWTCEPFGVPGLGWDVYEGPVPEEARQAFALVNGKRELWGGIPLNTNLCYGQPAVRRTMVDDVVRYLRARPGVRYLHLWLGDAANNQCECDLCRSTRPADFYVKLLNELDERLSGEGLDARIVFLVYFDLYWPPQTERLRNQDRFVLMFAPITRTYSASFAPPAKLPAMPPYVRNKVVLPKSVAENLSFLSAWQGIFAGDSFDFDYHWIWDHYADPGYMQVSRGLHRDLVGLANIGLDGYVSCQVQRSFFPTGLGMVVMGSTLWNRELGFDAIASDYFRAAFGEDAEACRAYLEELSEAFDPRYLRGETPVVDVGRVLAFERVPSLVRAFRPVMERNVGASDPCRAASWRYLIAHGRLCESLAAVLSSRAAGRDGEMRARAQGWMRLLWELEPELHAVLDVWMYQRTVGRRLGVVGEWA